MPYLKLESRQRLDKTINELASLIKPNHRAGELNYIFNRLMLAVLGEGKYADCNEMIGALESAKLEFYRKKIAKLEDKKVKENGDLPY